MEEDEENVPASPHVQDDKGMDDEEGKHNKKDNQTILPQKQALLRKRKGKFHPFDRSVLKLNDKFLTLLHCVVLMFLLFVVVIRCFGCCIS